MAVEATERLLVCAGMPLGARRPPKTHGARTYTARGQASEQDSGIVSHGGWRRGSRRAVAGQSQAVRFKRGGK
ncbi:hypothetical protein BC831DRAFT_476378 [Entophlyctis helioformis]|nr:hypothetical protein BC831DRAFT_476378 [Entophlyctis helioformis]